MPEEIARDEACRLFRAAVTRHINGETLSSAEKRRVIFAVIAAGMTDDDLNVIFDECLEVGQDRTASDGR